MDSQELQRKIDRTRRMVDQWIAAEEAVMTGQEYRIDNRMLRRADLRMIGERLKYWEDQLAMLEGQHRIRVKQIIPRNL